MASKTFKDSDILMAMEYLNDYESMVYGANCHYSNGAYYNLNKSYKESESAEIVKKLGGDIDESLLKSIWLTH